MVIREWSKKTKAQLCRKKNALIKWWQKWRTRMDIYIYKKKREQIPICFYICELSVGLGSKFILFYFLFHFWIKERRKGINDGHKGLSFSYNHYYWSRLFHDWVQQWTLALLCAFFFVIHLILFFFFFFFFSFCFLLRIFNFFLKK